MTLEQLARAIEEVEVAADAGHLRVLIRLQDRLSARVHAVASMVDSAELWKDDCATSMTAWQRAEGGLSSKAAARTAKTSARPARAAAGPVASGAGLRPPASQAMAGSGRVSSAPPAADG